MTIFLVLFLFLLLILAGSWYAYSVSFYAPLSRRASPEDPLKGEQYDRVSHHIFRMSQIIENIPCEEVFITSHDGLKLHGRYYHLQDGAPVEILFHGRSTVSTPASGWKFMSCCD